MGVNEVDILRLGRAIHGGDVGIKAARYCKQMGGAASTTLPVID
jgi:hypothetical protein